MEKKQIVFEPFCLDLFDERLFRGDEEIRLHPKAFAVLQCLTGNSGGLVTKQNLLETVWPGLHVTDAVLTESIRELRKALGDDAKNPKFIETVHGRGYRFFPTVVDDGPRTNVANRQQEIRFCSALDGVRIAYSTMGHGPPIVMPPPIVTHLEADLVEGPMADVYEALARHHTLVRFDLRGTGLSDRNVSSFSEEIFLQDLETVVDALKLQRFALYGLSAASRRILRYYAKHPDQVSHLIFYGANILATTGARKSFQDVLRAVMRASWEVGSKMRIETLMPNGGTREDVERLARWLRLAVSGEVLEQLMFIAQKRDDLAAIAARVSVPTLVIHRRGDHVPFVGGRELAAQIPGARFLALEGYNHIPATHEEAMEIVTPVVGFLAQGQDRSAASPAELGMPVTLLFACIEESTSLKRRVGEREDKKLLRENYDAVRRSIGSYQGKVEIDNASGVVASFFSASRALGCALHIRRFIEKRNSVNPDDAVIIRTGLDAVEQVDDYNGTSTQLAQRVCQSAEPGQVLVSDAVRQLVSGKGFEFEPANVKKLDRLDEPVSIYKLCFE